MTDKEFIVFLCEEIMNAYLAGKEPKMEMIETELINREIDPDDIFVY